ncbi:VCBS domain-containing protein, partial [Novosphingobium sp.]|uniref:VCBS domain-containing protein n=1 Tax=Novosphingobium sp. TaxID=1874826 RepID=UPI0025ECEDAD
MGNIPSAGGTTTSFGNTPQAKDDWYTLTEDALNTATSSYNSSNYILALDVMANDLGGNAKSLFSIDDAEGNPITDLSKTDLCTNTNYSKWETTDDGNWIRINNGKIEFKLADPAHPNDFTFARDINSLGAMEMVDDKFTYAIKLGNGTLSWATVHINIAGLNDAASITGTASGCVVEAGGVNNTIPGSPIASGDLDVTDADTGEAGFRAPGTGSLSGPYGAFTFDTATGNWTFTLNNSSPQTQALAVGEIAHQTLTITSLDGSATQTIDVSIKGTNDAPVITSQAQAGTVTEDSVLSVTGQVTASDVDHGAHATFTGNAADTYGTFTVDPDTGV